MTSLLLSLAASVLVLEASDENEAFERGAVEGVIAFELDARGHEVRSMGELDAEVRARLTGCGEEACVCEVANALGAQFVVFSLVERQSTGWVAKFVLMDVVVRQPVSSVMAEASTVQGLGLEIRNAAGRMADEIIVDRESVFWTGVGLASIGAGIFAIGGIWLIANNLAANDPGATDNSVLATGVTSVGAFLLLSGVAVVIVDQVE